MEPSSGGDVRKITKVQSRNCLTEKEEQLLVRIVVRQYTRY